MTDITNNKAVSGSAGHTIPAKSEAPGMFDRIAGRYDLLNRLLSMRRDVAWRKKLAAALPPIENLAVLDIATGTGDVLVSIMRERTDVSRAVGLDAAGEMLRLGRDKLARGFPDRPVDLVKADALAIPFADGTFDATTIAFGIRNVVDVNRALREMRRVLKPGGKSLILEFSLPANRLLRSCYLLYFRHVLPRLGRLISGDRQAYTYLNRTVEDFPSGRAFCRLMSEAGFADVTAQPLTFGIATIYTGTRK